MTEWDGLTLCMGVAEGKAIDAKDYLRSAASSLKVGASKEADTKEELERYKTALKETDRELKTLIKEAKQNIGESEAGIFEAHRMLLLDSIFQGQVIDLIKQGKTKAEAAVTDITKNTSSMLEEMDDDMLRGRAADVRDVGTRLMKHLKGVQEEGKQKIAEGILVAEELLPGQIVAMDFSAVKGVVLKKGTPTGHTAILLRAMKIPAVSQVDAAEVLACAIESGKNILLDAKSGTVIISPDEKVRAAYQEHLSKADTKGNSVAKEEAKPTAKAASEEPAKAGKKETAHGDAKSSGSSGQIRLYANVGDVNDIDAVLNAEAEGIGLLRSEFLFLDLDRLPTEEEQLDIYAQAAREMGEKPLTIRTLDMGADKEWKVFPNDEENPALGVRGIRFSLQHPDIFRTQLRAIYRASLEGNLRLMFPMVSKLDEIQLAKALVTKVQKDLDAEGIAYEKIPIGMMVETPAAALMSAEFAKEVDFFSIGTNDLTQYTLGMDRDNEKLARMFDAMNPAVLELIRITIQNAHAAGIEVSVCGELAADPKMAKQWKEMGVDILSMNPASIEEIRGLL